MRRYVAIEKGEEPLLSPQNVPGIGPMTESRMIECGLDSVAKLEKVFVEQQREEEMMMDFLKVSPSDLRPLASPPPPPRGPPLPPQRTHVPLRPPPLCSHLFRCLCRQTPRFSVLAPRD